MPQRGNVHDVRRFLGMINYLAKFLDQLSSRCEILRQLDRKGVEWNWTADHTKAFEEVKKLVTEAPVLAYYDAKKPITLQCDASQDGLGVTMLQQGSPVYYASRALTNAERNYSQIEKELLAVVFACTRLDHYLFGQSGITVESDHKPLSTITKKPIATAPKRLRRMLLALGRYDVNIIYKPGKEMVLADTLSRAYLKQTAQETTESEDICQQIAQITLRDEDITNDWLSAIRTATRDDIELQAVGHAVQHGWPARKKDVNPNAQTYYSCNDEMTIQDGLVYKNDRVVIPSSLRSAMIKQLHSTHLGMESCLRLARECFYWPGMTDDVREYVSRCSICNALRPEQCREPLQPSEAPQRSWEKVAMDLFDFDGRHYLIIVDYYSNFFEVESLPDLHASTTISKIRPVFARYGIPKTVVSDNGPQLCNAQFRKFAKAWNFEHIRASPQYPQSNGKAENAVKTCKMIMRKAKKANADTYLALLNFRATPSETLKASPAQLLYGRRLRTLLAMKEPLLTPTTTQLATVHKKIVEAKEQQKERYDKKSKDLTPLKTRRECENETAGRKGLVNGRVHQEAKQSIIRGSSRKSNVSSQS